MHSGTLWLIRKRARHHTCPTWWPVHTCPSNWPTFTSWWSWRISTPASLTDNTPATASSCSTSSSWNNYFEINAFTAEKWPSKICVSCRCGLLNSERMFMYFSHHFEHVTLKILCTYFAHVILFIKVFYKTWTHMFTVSTLLCWK